MFKRAIFVERRNLDIDYAWIVLKMENTISFKYLFSVSFAVFATCSFLYNPIRLGISVVPNTD